MRFLFTVLLAFTFYCGASQRLDTEYRTTTGDNESLHFLTFIDKGKCRVTFPARGHVMMIKRLDFYFNYKISRDTILFSGSDVDSSNVVVRRFLNSRFIRKSDRELYDIVSGYAYVDKELVKDKYTIYSIDGEIFKQNTKHGARGKLKRKMKKITKNADSYSINILKGKSTYDKYGLVGMNGVVEIERKK